MRKLFLRKFKKWNKLKKLKKKIKFKIKIMKMLKSRKLLKKSKFLKKNKTFQFLMIFTNKVNQLKIPSLKWSTLQLKLLAKNITKNTIRIKKLFLLKPLKTRKKWKL